MKLTRWMLVLSVLVGIGGATSVLAEDAPQAVMLKSSAQDLVLKGEAKCTGCHDESDEPQPSMLDLHPSVLSIGKTRHGAIADSRTPTCTQCHGESTSHISHKGSGKPPKSEVTFGKNSITPVEKRNEMCQGCHQKDGKRHLWQGSMHEIREVACTSCHQVHAAKDKVRDKRTQAEVCFTCHKEQRAQINKPSHHPIIEGKMTCSDCHNVHGSAGPKLMLRDSVVDTCYTCHMEKRGPFVHNHQPVGEDCSICHNPHGSISESMLKMRQPFLCNSCHTPHAPIQPSLTSQQVAPSSTQGWWNPVAITQGRACLNCHSQVHGSNNPGFADPASRNLFR